MPKNITEVIETYTPEKMAMVLTTIFGSQRLALNVCTLIKSQLNMYNGPINQKWVFWDETAHQLYPKLSEDEQRDLLILKLTDMAEKPPITIPEELPSTPSKYVKEKPLSLGDVFRALKSDDSGKEVPSEELESNAYKTPNLYMNKDSSEKEYFDKIKTLTLFRIENKLSDKPDGYKDMIGSITLFHDTASSVEEAINKFTKDGVMDAGQVSDGWHTFDELYEFRKLYNAALFNEWAFHGENSVHKSRKHHDGTIPFGDSDWFIVCAKLPTGLISNHYRMKDWDLFKIPDYGRALFEYDGHTAQDVAKRIQDYLLA